MASESDPLVLRARVAAGWLGPRLRELRAARGLTQKRLGELIGLPQSRIAEWECGPRGPVWEYAVRLALALDVSLDSLTREPTTRPAPENKS